MRYWKYKSIITSVLAAGDACAAYHCGVAMATILGAPGGLGPQSELCRCRFAPQDVAVGPHAICDCAGYIQ
ncbi:hypothetical protein J6590_058870 [Homalodisca vitripennis]|nr:hypothetical protein J6590_058870 [Homalodisca vitripennis]